MFHRSFLSFCLSGHLVGAVPQKRHRSIVGDQHERRTQA
ncbi:hypothetical protein L665_04344 [Ralstonia solanacearum SD54]|nr:hypothetical protein F504_4907 [Ralstonia pseudosolanacearum FQY_4]ESS49651.1 hypothetical protein L665_04344 [Ralstonia solanacearum SD54]